MHINIIVQFVCVVHFKEWTVQSDRLPNCILTYTVFGYLFEKTYVNCIIYLRSVGR